MKRQGNDPVFWLKKQVKNRENGQKTVFLPEKGVKPV